MQTRLHPRSSAQHTEQNLGDKPYNGENHTNDPADTSRLRCPAPAWVHYASIHLFEIFVSHDPGGNSKEEATNDPQDSECQDLPSPVWLIAVAAGGLRIRSLRRGIRVWAWHLLLAKRILTLLAERRRSLLLAEWLLWLLAEWLLRLWKRGLRS